ncbi:MAG: V-type ATPase subunit [Fastidiosipilaceae bacterium]|jgi:V/A-type H+-transporting ATPase subunit C
MIPTKREDYIFASSRVRQMEKSLLSSRVLRGMADEENFRGTLKLFSESSYGVILANARRADDYEFALKAERDRIYTELQELVPGSPVNDLLAFPYVYHDLKVLLKEHILAADFSHMLVPAGGIDINYLRGVIQNPERNPRKTDVEVAIRQVQDDYAVHHDPQRIDLLLDKACAAAMAKTAAASGVEMLRTYTEQRIDFINLNAFLRVRNQGKDGEYLAEVLCAGGAVEPTGWLRLLDEGQTKIVNQLKSTTVSEPVSRALIQYFDYGQMSDVEKARDDAGVSLALEGSSVTYGPEVLFAYALRKEAEIQNLRMILSASKMNIPFERIAGRLRRLDG